MTDGLMACSECRVAFLAQKLTEATLSGYSLLRESIFGPCEMLTGWRNSVKTS